MIVKLPSVYIAASRTELERVRAIASVLASVGFYVPCQWWRDEAELAAGDASLTPETAVVRARELAGAVMEADLVIYLAPPPSVGRGCHFEAGGAIFTGKPTICSGAHARDAVFSALATIVPDDMRAVACAISMFATQLAAARPHRGAA